MGGGEGGGWQGFAFCYLCLAGAGRGDGGASEERYGRWEDGLDERGVTDGERGDKEG